MRRATWLLGLLILTGCSITPDIILRNPAGHTARCEGFFVASGWGRSQLMSKLQRQCADDYLAAGYQRTPD